MAEIERYLFEDADGVEVAWSTYDATEAREYAKEHGYAMIAHTYEWSDSELVEDYRTEVTPRCDLCGKPEDHEPGRLYDWNGETGNHLSCETDRLAKLETEFATAGGRGPELADEIDSLRGAIATARLEELRAVIRAEDISYGEIAELQDLAEHIAPDDIELRQWAGLPEPLATDIPCTCNHHDRKPIATLGAP